MKILNKILNQLGTVFVIVVVILFYKGIIEFNLYTSVIIALIALAIFLASQLVWKKSQS